MDQKIINISTSENKQMVNITDYVKKFAKEANISDGKLTIFIPHTTAAVTINENADPSVKQDMLYSLKKISPSYKEFSHMEGNSDAHILSSIIGCSQDVLIKDNKLVLGTWQGIFFCEFDGPRNRRAILRID